MKFNTFPREVGLPRRIVRNMKEYLAYINLNNGKKNAIYTTLYSFKLIKERSARPHVVYDTAVVDKLFFDFDDKECNAYEEAKKLHDYCKTKHIKHSVVMSGRGYHIYIYLKNSDLKYKKEALRGGQMFFIDKLGLICDKQIVGDISRLTRVPNTFNIKGKRFCIPLTKDQFAKGDKVIKEKAVKQNFVSDVFIGDKHFDITQFDIKSESDFNLDVGDMKSVPVTKLGKLPYCISHVLCNSEPNYKERYLVILYFKEKGYTRDEVMQILKDHLSDRKFYHCIREERQLQYLFGRDDLVFPSCQTIKSDGFCPGKCEFHKNSIYK